MKSALFALLLVACASDPSDPAPIVAVDTPPSIPATTPTPPATTPPTRTLGTARAMGTRPENLVLDPTFGSLGQQYASVVYPYDIDLHVEVPATSPAGIAQPVLVATPTKGDAVVYFFVQGAGTPLDVRLSISGDASAYLATGDGQNVWSIDDTGEKETHEGRTYAHLAAHVDDPTWGKLYLVVQPTDTKASVTIAPPEVITSAVPVLSKLSSARRITLRGAAAKSLHDVISRPLVPGPIRAARAR